MVINLDLATTATAVDSVAMALAMEVVISVTTDLEITDLVSIISTTTLQIKHLQLFKKYVYILKYNISEISLMHFFLFSLKLRLTA